MMERLGYPLKEARYTGRGESNIIFVYFFYPACERERREKREGETETEIERET